MKISARRVDTQGPSRLACLFPGRQGERILKKLGDRRSIECLCGKVAFDECRLVARFGAGRSAKAIALRADWHKLERKHAGPGKSAKWIGLCFPIQIAKGWGESKRMVLGALVVSEDDFERIQSSGFRVHGSVQRSSFRTR